MLWLGAGLGYTFPAFGLVTVGGLTLPLGFMLLAVAIVSLGVLVATLFENLILSLVVALATLAGGFAGIGLMSETDALTGTGGWLMVIASAAAWYFATAILVAESIGRQILPIGRYRMAAAGGRETRSTS